jgi:hypothetical protein
LQRKKSDRTDGTCELRVETPFDSTLTFWGSDAVFTRTASTQEQVFDTYALGSALVVPNNSGLVNIHPVTTTHSVQNYVERQNGFILSNAGENKFTCTLKTFQSWTKFNTCISKEPAQTADSTAVGTATTACNNYNTPRTRCTFTAPLAVTYPSNTFLGISSSITTQAVALRTETETAIASSAGITLAGTYVSGITVSSHEHCMMQCLQTTGPTCYAYSYDSVADTCVFASSRTPASERSLTSTLYSINSHEFAIAGVTKTAGKCYWKADSDSSWTEQMTCYTHASRGACLSDSKCEYEYFYDSTNKIYYFSEAD